MNGDHRYEPESSRVAGVVLEPKPSLTLFSVPRQELSEYNATAIKSPTNTVTVQGLKAGAIYVFQVRARTVAGYGRYSGKMYFQTMTEGEWRLAGRRSERFNKDL